MGSRYLLDLADWCREAGLRVYEESGWEYRARGSGGYDSGKPWCIMWHHTASKTSRENDVYYICHGNPDAPVANLFLARDGSVTVCAGGASNTNGKGGPYTVSKGIVPMDRMNEYALSIEAGNDGVGEAWPQVQIDAYFALNAVLTARLGLNPADCCSHNVWAPTRKIDPATASAVQGPWRPRSTTSSGTWSLDDIKAECKSRAGPLPAPPTEDDDDMPKFIYAFQRYANTFSETGVALSPEAFNAMKQAGAIVVTSGEQEQHLESLLHLSGLDRSSLVPK